MWTHVEKKNKKFEESLELALFCQSAVADSFSNALSKAKLHQWFKNENNKKKKLLVDKAALCRIT